MKKTSIFPLRLLAHFRITPFLACGAVLFAASNLSRADVGYQFVTIGNAGNANDTVTASDNSGLFFGSVDYTYDIGKYDVTLNQYATFLNAVAQTDSYGLYNGSLASNSEVAGIQRSGISGSFSYSVIGSGTRPVTYVTWYDAARFANWIQNGQPIGLGEVAASTEQGAYTLNGATSGIIAKNAGAQFWIPTENEWYKAAYYDPTLNGGAGGYWTYATRSNSVPGNVVGSGTNQANYETDVYSVSQSSGFPSSNALTDVGAFTNSASAYGTYDQSGDVFNWTDSVVNSSDLIIRGGGWFDTVDFLASSHRGGESPAAPLSAQSVIGFRLASSVPEPSVWLSLVGGAIVIFSRRKRTKAG